MVAFVLRRWSRIQNRERVRARHDFFDVANIATYGHLADPIRLRARQVARCGKTDLVVRSRCAFHRRFHVAWCRFTARQTRRDHNKTRARLVARRVRGAASSAAATNIDEPDAAGYDIYTPPPAIPSRVVVVAGRHHRPPARAPHGLQHGATAAWRRCAAIAAVLSSPGCASSAPPGWAGPAKASTRARPARRKRLAIVRETRAARNSARTSTRSTLRGGGRVNHSLQTVHHRHHAILLPSWAANLRARVAQCLRQQYRTTGPSPRVAASASCGLRRGHLASNRFFIFINFLSPLFHPIIGARGWGGVACGQRSSVRARWFTLLLLLLFLKVKNRNQPAPSARASTPAASPSSETSSSSWSATSGSTAAFRCR